MYIICEWLLSSVWFLLVIKCLAHTSFVCSACFNVVLHLRQPQLSTVWTMWNLIKILDHDGWTMYALPWWSVYVHYFYSGLFVCNFFWLSTFTQWCCLPCCFTFYLRIALLSLLELLLLLWTSGGTIRLLTARRSINQISSKIGH